MSEYNHPELSWRTIETEHFYVHFHTGTERTAALSAKIAEDLYNPITELYEYEPDSKFHLIIRDHDDTSNGAAFYYNNKVEIWAPSLDFIFRGAHNWLRNVIAHELSHMISLGTARKMSRQLPAIYFQWLDYEKEKRPDVIHGYPNKLVSFPWAGTVLPLWFAEGMAQFQRAGFDYDTWDTHRDMLLRTAVLDDVLLSMNQMEILDYNSLNSERVYNQGYGLTTYLAARYGESILKELTHAMKQPFRFQFSEATRRILGKSDSEIYREWKAWLGKSYHHEIKTVMENTVQGRPIVSEGLANLFPVFSPNGNHVAFISSRKSDSIYRLGLYLYNFETEKIRKIKSRVTSSVSWSPDGQKLVYASRRAKTIQGSYYYDLYIYDLQSRNEKRITHYLRARQPDWSPDGQSLACIVESDGTANLAVMDTQGQNVRKITDFRNGEQIYTPRWISKDRIVFTISGVRSGRDIASIQSDGKNFQFLIQTEYDERDPSPSADGSQIVYSCDRTGIFNLYQKCLETGREIPITNVTGGAFMPDVQTNRNVIFSVLTSRGYQIAVLDSLEMITDSQMVYCSPYQSLQDKLSGVQWDIAQYDDTEIPEYESEPYKPIYSKLAFLPRLMVDYPQRLKIGTYFVGQDFLDKILVFGGAALNHQLDTDAFLIFEYRRLYPTLFIEAFHKLQHEKISDQKYVFDLMEVDVGADWPLGSGQSLRTAYIFDRYSASVKFQDQGIRFNYAYTYHIGNRIQLKWLYRNIPRSMISSIAPDQGRLIRFQIDQSWQRYLDGFEISKEYSTLVETYKKFNYREYSLDYREFLPGLIKNHSLALQIRGGFIDNKVDDFYWLRGGGLDGMKGYPFYSMEGRRLLHVGAAYRFPLFLNQNIQFLFFQFRHLYASLYADAGDAWETGDSEFSNWKTDAGIQLRMSMITYYAYPMKLFFDACYGLDRFQTREQEYGKSWRFYFGILFQFPDLVGSQHAGSLPY